MPDQVRHDVRTLDFQVKMETIKKYFRIDRKEIHFLKFILEAYDGIATLTTVDPELSIVRLNIPPGCEGDVEMVLQDLQKSVMIERANV
jgi:hypothetical protein